MAASQHNDRARDEVRLLPSEKPVASPPFVLLPLSTIHNIQKLEGKNSKTQNSKTQTSRQIHIGPYSTGPPKTLAQPPSKFALPSTKHKEFLGLCRMFGTLFISTTCARSRPRRPTPATGRSDGDGGGRVWLKSLNKTLRRKHKASSFYVRSRRRSWRRRRA